MSKKVKAPTVGELTALAQRAFGDPKYYAAVTYAPTGIWVGRPFGHRLSFYVGTLVLAKHAAKAALEALIAQKEKKG